jgi:hypothetical protein
MIVAMFDPDDIMREVRAKANPAPLAKIANLLKDESPSALPALAKSANPLKRTPDISSLAALATSAVSDRIGELISRPCPNGFAPERWAVLCNGAERFAQEWAAKATSLGWTFEELFALRDPFVNGSLQGAAWFIGDSTVTAVTADAITLRTEGGTTLRSYRQPRG